MKKEISVLGPIEWPPLAAGARRVLAVLTLRPGGLVRVDEILDAMWGTAPPKTARKVVQNHVVRLRTMLGDDAVATEPGGYRLLVPTDVPRFEHLARVDPERALDLWRGDPWPELDDWPRAAPERVRLVEIKLAAEERAVERRLDVADAQRLVDELPLRERRWAILMRALYASGRQADALRAAHRCRLLLREELGLDPGPELRELEAAIARQELDPRRGVAATTLDASEARRLGLDAHGRGDHVLAIQWLHMAGDDPRPKLALAHAAFAAGDWRLGLRTVREVAERAVVTTDAQLGVDAMVCLVTARGPSITIEAVADVHRLIESLAADFDDDQRLCMVSCDALMHSYTRVRRRPIGELDASATSPVTRTLVTLARLASLGRPHDAERRLAVATEITACGDREVDRYALLFGQHATLWSLLELGDARHEAARQQLLARAAESRHAIDRANAACWSARGLLDGDLALAEREAAEWLGPLAVHEGPGLAATIHPAFVFTVRWMQGRLDEVIPTVEAAAEAMPDVPTWRSALAMAYADAGRHDEARRLLTDFLSEDMDLEVGYGLWSATVFHLVNAAVAVGATDAIRRLSEVLEPIADRHAFYTSHHLGSFRHHLGSLRAAAGDAERARGDFEAAVSAHEALGSRWWAARSRTCLAAVS